MTMVMGDHDNDDDVFNVFYKGVPSNQEKFEKYKEVHVLTTIFKVIL